MNSKLLGFSLVGLVVLGIGGYFIYIELNKTNEDLDATAIPVDINEIYYQGSLGEDFIELYLSENFNGSMNQWIIVLANSTYKLPMIGNLSRFAHILVNFSLGTNDIDASDGMATIYLNSPTDIEGSGFVTLLTPSGGLADYVKWGGYSGPPSISSAWKTGDSGPIANVNESLQLFGPDTNSSENWMSTRPTPGYRNALEFSMSDLGYGAIIENGQVLLGNDEIERPGFVWHDQASNRWNVTFQVTNGSGVSAQQVREIQEMINFTAHFYEEQGFPAPVTMADGKVHVQVKNGTSATTAAGATSNGRFVIELGFSTNKEEVKVAVEHEMMHLVQWAKKKNAQNETVTNMPDPPSTNNWWEEGMAEYWGERSAMANYNETMAQIQEALRTAGSANWFDFGRNLNGSTFSDWPGRWDDYTIAFLFVKFIIEKYGNVSMLCIQNTCEKNLNNVNKSVSARQALEKCLNLTMDEILAEYYLWRVVDRQGGQLPAVQVPTVITIGNREANSSLQNLSVVEYGPKGSALVQKVILNGSRPIEINFTKVDGDSNWTVIVVEGNGTSKTINVSSPSGSVYRGPSTNLTELTLIKIRSMDGGVSRLNLSIKELPNIGTNPSTSLR